MNKKIPINQVLCDDCSILSKWPTNCVDLIITSPPYNRVNSTLGYQPRSTVGQNLYDEYSDTIERSKYIKWILATIENCIRISRYVFWNMQYLSTTKECISEIFHNSQNNIKDIFIWEKQAVSQINKNCLANGFEFVFCFGKDNKKSFKYNNFPKNGYVPNIKTWYKSESFPEHHATFPLQLPLYFIEHFCKPNDIVLDPFVGSGTTCVAAKKLHRNYLGIDISKKYCELSRRRLKQIKPDLFIKKSKHFKKDGFFDG